MTKGRSQERSEKAAAMPRLLLPIMQNGQPKLLTKDELRVAAIRQLNVSKSSFDFAWIDAIETIVRHDWYQPLRSTAGHQARACLASHEDDVVQKRYRGGRFPVALCA